jgi:hypothetical protein
MKLNFRRRHSSHCRPQSLHLARPHCGRNYNFLRPPSDVLRDFRIDPEFQYHFQVKTSFLYRVNVVGSITTLVLCPVTKFEDKNIECDLTEYQRDLTNLYSFK